MISFAQLSGNAAVLGEFDAGYKTLPGEPLACSADQWVEDPTRPSRITEQRASKPKRAAVVAKVPSASLNIRWTARRKAELLAGLLNGRLSREEACRDYELSEQELSAWETAFATYGKVGLNVTRPWRSSSPGAPSGTGGRSERAD